MSGLGATARSIRTSLESDEHDLAGGVTEAQAVELVRAAFGTPLPCSKPLKVTFIVGGGKGVRAKYDEKLPLWLSGELRVLGYEEDRGASLGSQRCYKRQVRGRAAGRGGRCGRAVWAGHGWAGGRRVGGR